VLSRTTPGLTTDTATASNTALERTAGSHALAAAAHRERYAAPESEGTRPGYAGTMKVSEVLRMLHDDGWRLVATKGSHRQFKHGSKPGRVTVPGKPSGDLAPGHPE
jgi:predicted RNA binding protein YcfA (HicA-like mRNA interferase family)